MCIYCDYCDFYIDGFPRAKLANHIITELDKIGVWLKHNKLSLNVKKIKCMMFHTSQKKTFNSYSSQ